MHLFWCLLQAMHGGTAREMGLHGDCELATGKPLLGPLCRAPGNIWRGFTSPSPMSRPHSPITGVRAARLLQPCMAGTQNNTSTSLEMLSAGFAEAPVSVPDLFYSTDKAHPEHQNQTQGLRDICGRATGRSWVPHEPRTLPIIRVPKVSLPNWKPLHTLVVKFPFHPSPPPHPRQTPQSVFPSCLLGKALRKIKLCCKVIAPGRQRRSGDQPPRAASLKFASRRLNTSVIKTTKKEIGTSGANTVEVGAARSCRVGVGRFSLSPNEIHRLRWPCFLPSLLKSSLLSAAALALHTGRAKAWLWLAGLHLPQILAISCRKQERPSYGRPPQQPNLCKPPFAW